MVNFRGSRMLKPRCASVEPPVSYRNQPCSASTESSSAARGSSQSMFPASRPSHIRPRKLIRQCAPVQRKCASSVRSCTRPANPTYRGEPRLSAAAASCRRLSRARESAAPRKCRPPAAYRQSGCNPPASKQAPRRRIQRRVRQVHYAPLHLMPYYQQFGNKKGSLPVVEEYYEHCLSLPMYPTLTDQEQEYVIEKVIEFVKAKNND